MKSTKFDGKKMPCQIYSRVTGYFQPVNQWNAGKAQEFKERKEFSEAVSIKTSLNRPQIPDSCSMIVYSLPMCSGCIDLKAALNELGISFCERDGKEYGHELRQLDINIVSATFPVVWDGEKVTQSATIQDLNIL